MPVEYADGNKSPDVDLLGVSTMVSYKTILYCFDTSK